MCFDGRVREGQGGVYSDCSSPGARLDREGGANKGKGGARDARGHQRKALSERTQNSHRDTNWAGLITQTGLKKKKNRFTFDIGIVRIWQELYKILKFKFMQVALGEIVDVLGS